MHRAGSLLLVTTLLGCRAIPHVEGPRVAHVGTTRGAPIETRADAVETDDAAENEEGDDTLRIRPCEPSSPETVAAQSALDAFEAKLTSASDDAPVTPLEEELATLRKTRCFALSEGDSPFPDLSFDSALAMKHWWAAGGAQWLGHYLTIAATREAVLPPTPRHALVKTKGTSHPLSPLLCPASSIDDTSQAACGREATGWARRADGVLRRDGLARTQKTVETCTEEVKAEKPGERYGAFRTCLEEVATKRDALPIGRFKAPTDGWIVMVGIGNRHGCASFHAYDLATGAAYVQSSCRTPQSLEVGRVSLATLREAAWMLLLAGVAETDRRLDASSFTLPTGVSIERPDGARYGLGMHGCGGSSSIREWSWMRGKSGSLSGQVSGALNFSGCATDAESYAAELVQAMEDTFVVGCAPASPPLAIAWERPGPGADPNEMNETTSFMKSRSKATTGIEVLAPGARGDAFLKARPKAVCAALP